MTLLIERQFPRTLDALVQRFHGRSDLSIEAWLFEDEAARRAGEDRLAASGVTARLRSAYKPLVHAFLEEIDLAGATNVEIAYPVHEAADERRFLIEAYPLAGLIGRPVGFGSCKLRPLTYAVTIHFEDRPPETIEVEAPNRVHPGPTGATVLSPTGWLRVLRNGAVVEDARLETDFEALFEAGMAAFDRLERAGDGPIFEELRIEAHLPFGDRTLGFGDEAISLTEALHEDFYFSGLDVLQSRAGRPAGDRSFQPGRIVPAIATREGAPGLRMELRPHAEPPAVPRRPRWTPLEAEAPLNRAEIERALRLVDGEAFSGRSVCGRPVEGRYRAGPDAPVLVTGGQHANEPTGIAGALLAGADLAARASAHFALIPLENPDGHALCGELMEDQPRHMRHAARYTALGDDLEFRISAPLFEREAREAIVDRMRPGLHVNCHGYPAHEWTRPLTGYLPQGFERWTVPRGFFLILRHHPGHGEAARRLARFVAERLATIPELAALNARQIALHRIHAGDPGLEVHAGIPVTVVEDTRHRVPVTLVTEFPDETILGEAFRLGARVQAAAVIAAYEGWQTIVAEGSAEV